MEEEMILVVRRALFDSLGAFQGFSASVDRYLPSLLDRENNFFVARSSAETDPSLKQIIPYALIVAGRQILRYRRGKSSGEQRLVAKYSIGIGGHMNDQDEGLFALDHQAYLAGVQREIQANQGDGCAHLQALFRRAPIHRHEQKGHGGRVLGTGIFLASIGLAGIGFAGSGQF